MLAAARQLAHPNVVSFVDFESTPQHFYLVMELCTGGELLQQIVNRVRTSCCDLRLT